MSEPTKCQQCGEPCMVGHSFCSCPCQRDHLIEQLGLMAARCRKLQLLLADARDEIKHCCRVSRHMHSRALLEQMNKLLAEGFTEPRQ